VTLYMTAKMSCRWKYVRFLSVSFRVDTEILGKNTVKWQLSLPLKWSK